MPRPPGPHRDDPHVSNGTPTPERELLEAVFEAAGTLLIVLDREGRIVRFNRALEALTGWSLEQARGRAVWEVLVAPEEQEASRAMLAHIVRRREGPLRAERAFLTRSGERRLIELYYSVIPDAAGDVRLVIGAGDDVTERRAADARREESERWWRTLLDQASEGVLVAGPDQRLIEVNARACELTGFSRDELLGTRIADLHAAEDLARQPLRIPELDAGGRVVTERRIRRADGTWLDAELSTCRIADGHYVALLRDVRERREIEHGVRAQRAAQLGTWEWDAMADSVHWSEPLRRIYGVPDGYAPSRAAYLDLVHPDDRALVHEISERALHDRRPFDYEVRIVRPDGGVRILRTRGEVHCDDAGRVVRVTGTGQDVTERRYLEMRLRMAEKLESVGRLAGGVAHDFNNLLTAMMGHAEQLVDGLDPQDPLHHSAEQVGRAARQAAVITRQLLAFARRQHLEPRVLDLNQVILAVREVLQRMIGGQIELVTLAAARDGRVHADPGQIEHVVLELVVNARDALGGAGRITVAVEDAELDAQAALRHAPAAPGRYVALTVRDNGPGMDPGTRARVFEPFFTTKSVGHGYGLGLATVYGIVKQSGGTIWIDSEPGRGTTFRVFLPRAVDGGPELAAGSDMVVSAPRTTILVVEDDPAVLTLLESLLARAGYEVITAADPEQAAAAATAHARIDLMIADVALPRMDGRELARRLTAERPGLRTLFVSGIRGVPAHPGPAGSDFLAKPFTPAELERAVRALLEAPAPAR